MGGQWRKTPRWAAGGTGPPRPWDEKKRDSLHDPVLPTPTLGLRDTSTQAARPESGWRFI
jgi:hypothetical protein